MASPIRYVFHRRGIPITDFRTVWLRACASTKIGHKVPHDLRRTAVRNLVRAGVSATVADDAHGSQDRQRLHAVRHHQQRGLEGGWGEAGDISGRSSDGLISKERHKKGTMALVGYCAFSVKCLCYKSMIIDVSSGLSRGKGAQCPEQDSNLHEDCSSTDFKSATSTSFAIRASTCNLHCSRQRPIRTPPPALLCHAAGTRPYCVANPS